MNYRLQEKIDDFHAGRMTPEQISSFENEIAKDPSLVSESNFQKEIVDGLKEYRKSQLKSRLDAIDVAPTWFEFAQQSTLLKSFGGVAIATIIGAGVYLYAEPSEENVSSEMVISAPVLQPTYIDWKIRPAEIPDRPTSLKLASANSVKRIETRNQDPVIEESKEFVPTFEAPDAGKIEAEEVLETALLDELPADTGAEEAKDPIDVDTEITKSLDVRYKYYDGKLFLSGDFDRAPYEILEINSADGRRIYVKYINKYYRVEITDRLSALPEVSDPSLIAELELLRENK